MNQEQEQQIKDFVYNMHEETFENEEWELYLLFSLVYYMAWYFRWKWKPNHWFLNIMKEKKDTINIHWITPKWWSYRKTHFYLFVLFKELNIKADVDSVKESLELFFNIWNKWEKKKFNYKNVDNDSVYRFLNKEETTIFFEEPLFLLLEDKFYEWIRIKNNFDTDENIEKIFTLIDEKIKDFVDWTLEKNYWVYSFNKQKEILLNKLATFQNLIWNMFKISEDNFWEKWNEKSFCYLYFFIFLFRNDYIYISDISSTDEIPLFDEKWDYLCENEKYSFGVYLKPKIISLIEWWIKLKEVILDKVFDDEYKEITIQKKNWKPYLLEWNLEFIGDENKFIELKKKFPYSKIEVDVHDEKINKYKLKEKIKLENNDK